MTRLVPVITVKRGMIRELCGSCLFLQLCIGSCVMELVSAIKIEQLPKESVVGKFLRSKQRRRNYRPSSLITKQSKKASSPYCENSLFKFYSLSKASANFLSGVSLELSGYLISNLESTIDSSC